MLEHAPKATTTHGAVRTADVLGAFSLASDLAMGLPAEHGVRSCYIGMRIAEELRLSDEQRVNLYYTELLKDAGCTTWTSQLAASWMVDELAAKRDLQFFRDAGNPLDVVSWLARYVAAGMPISTRAARFVDFFAHGKEFMREGFESTCQVATRIAGRLGMPRPVQDALMHVFEQWDGRGMPQGSRRNDIPLLSRVVMATSFIEVFHRVEGREGARRIALARRGKSFDPEVVDAFESLSHNEGFWKGLEAERIADTVASMEPEDSPHRYLGQDRLTDLALAFADYADLKAPHLVGHSRRVGELSEQICRRMSLAEKQVTTITAAALAHDIGVVAVPSFVLNKPDVQRTAAEREEVRLHPYHSQRILARIPALEGASQLVAAHHERIDGGGYHRGLSGFQIPIGARIIAVVDRFDELCHDTPDGRALEAEAAFRVLREEAGTRLGPETVEALVGVLEGAELGRLRARRQEWPAGLTEREVEVLRLAARGMNRKKIASALTVTEGTVRSHLEHIYGKIGVSNRSAATLFAMEHGLVG
ncbi:MAG: HD domain-containing protein [Chloroflexi bacterium]|nr:HD domain-containing protein [Chloroflexota bacterium]